MVLPAWLASTVQGPAAMKETAPPLMVQSAAVEESMVRVTASPEVAVAAGV